MNKVLIVILTLLFANLCREYIWVKPPSAEKSVNPAPARRGWVNEPLSSLDFNIQRNDWSYYEDVFVKPIDIDIDLPQLPLVLKGTVISNPRKSFAIIEDLETGIQDLYGLGDTIGNAKIVAMNRNRVVMEYNGQKQELKMFEEQSCPVNEVAPYSSPPAVDFAKLLTQVRIKPYFEAGKCIGFQLSSIRNGSLIERMGLKEGDIIETVNGVRVDDPLKALQLLYAVERNNPVHLGIERQDEKMELDCRIES